MEHNPPDLNTATLQEIFDYGVEFLRKQGMKSVITLPLRQSDGTLEIQEFGRYRLEQIDGSFCRCGVGCFLPDERYDPAIEGIRVISLRNRFFNYEPAGRKMDLLLALQNCHDNHNVEDWEPQWKQIATDFELIYRERT